MLVLSRKEGERIVIGPDIVITVIESRGNRVRLGITAPQATPVNREEVLERRPRAQRTNPADHNRAGAFFCLERN